MGCTRERCARTLWTAVAIGASIGCTDPFGFLAGDPSPFDQVAPEEPCDAGDHVFSMNTPNTTMQLGQLDGGVFVPVPDGGEMEVFVTPLARDGTAGFVIVPVVRVAAPPLVDAQQVCGAVDGTAAANIDNGITLYMTFRREGTGFVSCPLYVAVSSDPSTWDGGSESVFLRATLPGPAGDLMGEVRQTVRLVNRKGFLSGE